MKLSTILAASAVAATTMAFALPASADQIDHRQHRQAKRIEQGVRSGQLTAHEAARLRAEQARINRLEHLAERDGHVNHYERARIRAAQHAASRHIYEEKHDGQNRNRRIYRRWW